MSEPRRRATPPVVLAVVAATAVALGFFAIERLAWLAATAEDAPTSAAHSWNLIAIQGLVLAVLCLAGAALWLLRRRDEALAAEASLRAVLEAAPNGVAILDGGCRILMVNAGIETLFGYDREELLGRSIETLLPTAVGHFCHRPSPDLPPVFRTDLSAIRGLELNGRRKDGRPLPVAVSLGVVDAHEQAVAACVIHDLSDRLREEARLREAYRALRFANDRLRGVVEGTSDLIAAFDLDRRYILLNAAYKEMFQRLFGREVDQGMRLDDVLADRPEDLARLRNRWDRALKGEMFKVEVDYPDVDGGPLHLEFLHSPIRDERGSLLGASQVIRDVTDRVEADEALRRNAAELHALSESRETAFAALQNAYEELKLAESRLVQAEKLSALGQLIAGVAHEINNPLAFVGNDLATLQRDVAGLVRILRLYQQVGPTITLHHPRIATELDELADQLDLDYSLEHLESLTIRARDGLGRIRRIVKDLRDFARLDEGELVEADLNAGVGSTVDIIGGLARDRDVRIELDLSPLPVVSCEAGKINQVLLNLLINALDASTAGDVVTIRTRTDGPDGVSIEVVDEGAGIAPSVLGRIFDPFFTTKPVGQGTGLGLSISYGIIQDHGGRIEVESTQGEGSRFTIHLPITPPAKADRIDGPPLSLRDGDGTRLLR